MIQIAEGFYLAFHPDPEINSWLHHCLELMALQLVSVIVHQLLLPPC